MRTKELQLVTLSLISDKTHLVVQETVLGEDKMGYKIDSKIC